MRSPDKIVPAQVIYIYGSMRSGTTLLGRLIDIPGSVAIGESTDIFRALANNEMCSCGSPAQECPLWGEVPRDDAESWQSVVGQLSSWAGLVALLGITRSQRRDVKVASEAMTPVLTRALELATSGWLVDSTKHLNGVIMRRRQVARVCTIHVVRDPRGVAFSDLSSQGDASAAGAPPGKSLIKSCAHWLITNLVGLLFLRDALCLTYEELTQDPDESRARIARHVGVPLNPRVVPSSLTVDHILVGNPGKHRAIGDVRQDVRWREGLPRATQLVITCTTMWLYRLLQRRASHQAAKAARVPKEQL